METLHKILVSGLNQLNLTLSESQIHQLLNFIALIEKWNKAYNLTAIRNKEEMVRLHLLDSLSVAPYVEGKRVIDIGTGAGLPGIPLAICLPDVDFTLLDSSSKKTRFVQQVVLELKLKNVIVCTARVESYNPPQLFDAVLTRAFADLNDIVKLTAHLLTKSGVLMAMKGQVPDDLEQFQIVNSVIALNVPGVEAERCLIKIGPIEEAES